MNYQFNGFEVDTLQFKLFCSGQKLAIEPKVFDLLVYLLKNRHRTVTRDEIFGNVWHGQTVGDTTLSNHITSARKVLGDNGDEQSVIATIRGRGYQFIAETQESTSADSIDSSSSSIRKLLFRLSIIILIFVVSGLLANYYLLNGSSEVEIPKDVIEPEGTSIAVLPFVNMSSDKEQEYFSDGISEEILNVLAKIPNLHVTSRSSAFFYKGKDIIVSDVANKLGVKHILEGSVRRSGSRIRITAQLIEAGRDKNLWSETYDRELDDIFKIQDEISVAIVDALKETLGIALVKTVTPVQTINPEAYDLYLQGLREIHATTFDSYDNAVIAFESAIKIAPDFLMARIKLAETFARQINEGSRFDVEILDTADAILMDVLSINPDSAEAYYVRSLLTYRWSFSIQREQVLRKQYIKEAYRLNPNNVDIIIIHAQANGAVMGEKKARGLFRKAQQIDPLNADILYSYAWYLLARLQEYSEAEQTFKQAIKMNPNYGNYSFSLAYLYAMNMGNIVDAVKIIKKSSKLDPIDPDNPRELSMHYLSLGDEIKSLEYVEKAIAMNANRADLINQKINVLIYAGKTDKVLTLAKDTLDNPETVYRYNASRGLLLSTAIYLLIKTNKLVEAEALINQHLPEKADESGNPYGIPLLTTVYKLQGKLKKAQKIADRVKFRDEHYYIKDQVRLSGIEYLILARENSLLENNEEKTITYLEAAIDNGYLRNWRSMILHVPFFISLHQHPRFIALIERLEAEMTRQRSILEQDSIAE